MMPEPRSEADYNPRQIEAARRVLVDVGQVLASFADCLVVVGGWAPDLLLPNADEPHVGSIDVDIAIDAAKLNGGAQAVVFSRWNLTSVTNFLEAVNEAKPSQFELSQCPFFGDRTNPWTNTVAFLKDVDDSIGIVGTFHDCLPRLSVRK
jgi:hypothetical protein